MTETSGNTPNRLRTFLNDLKAMGGVITALAAVIGVAFGVYTWLESKYAQAEKQIEELKEELEENYARVSTLKRDKCELEFEIKITQNEIERQDIDELIDKLRSEKDELLRTSNPPTERVGLLEATIENLVGRSKNMEKLDKCLLEQQDYCETDRADHDECDEFR